MIEIDDRVGAVELADHLPHNLVKVKRLKYADVWFMGNGPEGPVPIGVERKRLNDLLQSMADGRLVGHQLLGMSTRYSVVYLLIEGMWRADPREGVIQVYRKRKWVPVHHGKRMFMMRDLAAFLNTLSVLCGVRMWRSDTIQASGQWLLGLYRWWQKEWTEHKSHLRFHDIPDPTRSGARLVRPSLMQRILKEFPGVGWERAKDLAKAFPTVGSLADATERDLLRVRGVGKVLARQIWEGIHINRGIK